MFKVIVEFTNSEKEFEFSELSGAYEFAELVQTRGYNSKLIGPGHFTKTMILTFPRKEFV